MKNTPKKNKDISEYFQKCVGRAIVIAWHNKNHDWYHFRNEGIFAGRILLSGVADDIGNRHTGDFFTCTPSEIESVVIRRS